MNLARNLRTAGQRPDGTALAFDADDVEGEFAESDLEPKRRRNPYPQKAGIRQSSRVAPNQRDH